MLPAAATITMFRSNAYRIACPTAASSIPMPTGAHAASERLITVAPRSTARAMANARVCVFPYPAEVEFGSFWVGAGPLHRIGPTVLADRQDRRIRCDAREGVVGAGGCCDQPATRVPWASQSISPFDVET